MPETQHPFRQTGGEMGALTRAYDWSQTALGAPERWSLSLRSTVQMMLTSRFPMLIFWGPELITFYNDAFRPSLGNDGKHPGSLGQRGEESWAESWPVIGPMIRTIMAGGEAVWFEDQKLPIYREGAMGYAYWTYSFSPLIDDDGTVGGVLVTCSETTKAVESIQALKESKEEVDFAIDATELGVWDLNPATGRFTANARLKSWFGLQPDDEIPLQLAIDVIDEADRERVAAAIAAALQPKSGGRYEEEYSIRNPANDRRRIVRAKGRARFDADGTAYRLNGTLQDVTEQRLADEAIRDEQERFQNMVRDVTLGIVVLTGDDMHVSIVNDAYAGLVGHRADELRGKKLFDVLPEAEPYFRPIIEGVIRSGEPLSLYSTPYSVSTADGAARDGFLNLVYQPYRESDGTVNGVMVLCHDVTEQVAAQQQLKNSEARFRSLIEESPVGTCLYLGREMRVAVANETILSYWGKGSEAIGKTMLEIHPELAGQQFPNILDRVFTTGEAWSQKAARADLVVNGVPGTYYFDVTYKPLRNEAGEVYGILDMAVDVTEQVRMLHALEESETRVRTLIEESPVASCLFIGRELRVAIANPQMIATWGKGPDVIDKPLVEILPELKGQPFLQILDDVFTTGIPFEGKAAPAQHVVDGQAVTRYFDFIYKPLHDSQGAVYGVMDVAIDVTEQVQATQILEANQRQLQALFEQAPTAIAILDRDRLTVKMANEFYCSIIDRKCEDILGRPLLEVLPEMAGQGFDTLMQGVIDTGIPYTADEVSIQLVRNGQLETFYVDLSYNPMREPDGTISGVFVVANEVTQQVTARRQIEASETKFRSLIEEAPFATAVYVGEDLIIDTANDAMIRLWGKTPAVVGTRLAEALPELEGQPFIDLLQGVLRTGETYETKEQAADLVIDGKLQRFWFSFTYKPLRDEAGNVYAILNMAVDVSAQVQARRQVEESALFIRSIIDNSPVAKVVFRGEAMVVDIVNQNMLEMLGRDASIIGMPFMDAIPELRETPLMERLRHVYQTGETYYQPEEAITLMKDGSLQTGYYNYIYKPLRDTTGAIYGIITTATDVTDQVLARKKVEEAQAALKTAIELAELGTWRIDLATGQFFISQRVEEWYGIVSGGPIDALLESIPEEDALQVRDELIRAMEPGGTGAFDIEHAIINRNTGRRRLIHAQGTVQQVPGQTKPVLEGVAQDITLQRENQTALESEVQTRTEELAAAVEELRATNEELGERTEELAAAVEEIGATNEELQEANTLLAHSNDELAQYAYVASHDLQEPLRKIQVFSSMLSNQGALPDASRETVQKIRSSAERMSLLIRDLLDFSRLLRSDALMRPVSLKDIVQTVWDDFELQTAEKNAVLDIESLPVIEAVHLQMNQLFYNLLSNALKFTTPDVQPRITVRATLATPELVAQHISKPLPFPYYDIVFQDNGIGFESQYAEQIFEVFKRLHGRDLYPGSGIGLALCRRIVSNHHGFLHAVSEPGRGTAFHILLPERQHDAGLA